MLAYILALLVGFFSLYLLATAFITPSIHRKDDFLWSAVGLFYALVLWLCAGQFKGAVLLGQAAVVILLLAIGWQNLNLRRVILSPDNQQALLGFSVIDWLQGNLGKVVSSKAKKSPIAVKPKEKSAPVQPAPTPKVEEVVSEQVTTVTPEIPVVNTVEEEEDNWSEFESEEKEDIKPVVFSAPVIQASEPVVAEEEEDNWSEFESEVEEIQPIISSAPVIPDPEPVEELNQEGEAAFEENITSVTPGVEIPLVAETEGPPAQEELLTDTVETEGEKTDRENGGGDVIETVIVSIESTPEITEEQIQQEILEVVEAAAEIGTIESVEITTTETIIINLEPPQEDDRRD